ncbi:uncharacterized protein [Fopius arisanus]|uniref:Uncharacterized protein n=1 Tax=Fopius arisanus TaxID=64838 RepID=A0A9R1U583_9HYME|nr:PREDICTED: uncharacterized protein LOC105270027 [Fopius arisanus]
MMQRLKYFLAIFPLALGLGESGKGVIQNAVDFCAMERGFPVDRYQNFINDYMSVELNECVVACVMKKLGTMSEDGTYTGEEARNLIAKPETPGNHEDTVDNAITRCASLYGKGQYDCLIARNLQICFKILFRQIVNDDWLINGLINQALLSTFEDYLDSYPIGRELVNNTNIIIKLLPTI